jgi:DNA repair exonuclease SbcCD ATPase subunit
MTRYGSSERESVLRPPRIPRVQTHDQSHSCLKPHLGTESTGSSISNVDLYSFSFDERRDEEDDVDDSISILSGSSIFIRDGRSEEHDQDDVFMHKYLTLKKKLRMASTDNLHMKVRIKELKKAFEDQNEASNKERLVLEAKIQESNQNVSSLQDALSKIEKQVLAKEKHHSDQMKLLRTETEMQVDRIQRREEQKLVELQDELVSIESKLKATTERYEEEKLKNQESAGTLITLQNEFRHQKAEVLSELHQREAEIVSLQRLRENSRKENEKKSLEIEKLRDMISALSDDLRERNEKCNDYKEGMKYMSIDYINSVQDLDQLRARLSKNARHMDAMEKRMRAEMTDKVKIAKQLEKLSHGYVMTDNLLEKEQMKTKNLQENLATVTQDLENQIKKSDKLSLDLELSSNSLESSRLQVSQLKKVNEDLVSEVKDLKTGLTQAIVKVKSLSQKGIELEGALEKTIDELKMVQDNNVKMSSDLKMLQDQNVELNQNLQSTKLDLHNTKIDLNRVTGELQEKSSLAEKLSKDLEEERVIHNQSMLEKDEFLQILSRQVETIPSLKDHVSSLEVESADLHSSLEKIKNDYFNLEQVFEQEKEDTAIILNDKDEQITSLRKDYKSLESRYSTVFNSLVETEDKLQATRESLNETKLHLEKRNAEFEPTETMLRQEIAKFNRNMTMEKEKTLSLSQQLDEVTHARNVMNGKLEESVQKTSILEEQLLNLERHLSTQEKMCKDLTSQLDGERSNPLHKKLKAAKKMILAEKERYRAVLSQVEDQNEIIIRVEDELKRYQKELKITKDKLKAEKSEKVYHSSNVLQEMYKDLEDEKKMLRDEKEGLRGELKTQKALAISLALRLKVFESKESAEKEFVEELKKHYELSTEFTKLADENDLLKNTIQKQNESSNRLSKQLASVEEQLTDFKTAMSNLKDHCKDLEEENKTLKDQLHGAKAKTSTSLYHELHESDGEYGSSISFDDFSVAEIPAPRLVYGNYILDRATARSNSDGKTKVGCDKSS